MHKKGTGVAIVMPGWVPARIPFLNRLATNSDIHPTVFLMNRVQVGRTNAILPYQDIRFDYRILSSLTLPFKTRAGDVWPIHINPALHWHIAQGNYSAVVVLQWTALYAPLVLLQTRMQSKAILLWEESISHPSSKLKYALSPLISMFFREFDACIAASSRCKDYLVEMGAKTEAVFLSGTPIDTSFFKDNSLAISQDQKSRLKHELGIERRRIILFAGQFIPRKGVMILLEAFAKLLIDRGDVAMLMLGSGMLLDDMRDYLRSHNLEKAVRILGYIQHSDLPKYHSISDVFVLPSLYDAFPVAIHEAMASGLPVITTEMVGATPDLVIDGINGFIVPPGNISALHFALREILKDENRRQGMGEASQAIIEEWTIEKAVNGFCRAIEYSLDSKLQK